MQHAFWDLRATCTKKKYTCLCVSMIVDLKTDAATHILTHKQVYFCCVRICTYAFCIRVCVVGRVCHVHAYTCWMHISKSTQPRTCSHVLIFGIHVSIWLDSLMRFIAKLTQTDATTNVLTLMYACIFGTHVSMLLEMLIMYIRMHVARISRIWPSHEHTYTYVRMFFFAYTYVRMWFVRVCML